MDWFYWLTEVKFYGPWHLSQYAFFTQAESCEQAIANIKRDACGLYEDAQRLTSIGEPCREGFKTQEEAKEASRREYLSRTQKQVA